MPAKIYNVTLTTEEREELTALVNKGKGPAGKLKRARILLMADEDQDNGGWKDADIVQALRTSRARLNEPDKTVSKRVLKRPLTTRVLGKRNRKCWMVRLKPDWCN